ncbi:MAG: CHAD domain-containing protein [Myxococcota bacterium]
MSRPRHPPDRAIRDALDAAVGALATGGGPDQIHAARTACKRARAAVDLWLVDPGPIDRAIRDAARLLAPARDADVLRALADHHGVSIAIAVPAAVDREAAARSASWALRAAADLVARAAVDVGLEADRATDRLIRSWRRARRAVRRARAIGDAAALHDLRKRVKRTLHQAELLGGRAAAAVAPGLDRLQRLLGDHHDAAELVSRIDPADPRAEPLRVRLADRTDQALALARVVLAAHPRRFRQAIEADRR